ncbi:MULTISPECIES: hypothetical protein [unclassified Saccharopolyspora]|uniref:hypothetical protein n=1 Tax=unclassified Saccharopolyspora TaxID=2646250 RepID=UPI001CD440FF|nr:MULTISPECIES: hypothetical protein [unclassified Saccharopolyspora]MCA1189016.1 hypothetical protein [Saccharopolyspora sp. 6T]MCA1191217.1 hypothetical protein [Saccharopolyspora sp. 6V]MCA1228894.1 hypothetical protein [Saccharopolyspora sp. 6M]MCA1281922.1 hypothetical protein [Saccharopolyspora sp. 7B]
MTGWAWLTSEWCSTWHLVGRGARGAVIVATCGHPLTGRMSRVLDIPPPDGREVCQSCVAAVAHDDEPGTSSAFEIALVVLSERRSFHAEPPPEPPIAWPEQDPDAPGRIATPQWLPPIPGFGRRLSAAA